MNRPALGAFLTLVLAAFAIGQTDPEQAKEKPKSDVKEQQGLTELRAETDALQVMHDFKLTVAQIKKLQHSAKTTMGKFRSTKLSRSSKEYLEKLTELRDALIDPQDDDAIEDLFADLAEMAEDDAPELNHRFDLTRESRKEAKAFVKTLSPRQLAGYLSLVKDDLLDPRETLIESLGTVRQLQGEDWKRRREEIAEDVAGAAAGIDERLENKLNNRVISLLVKSHDLSDEDFAKQRGALEKEALALFGNVTSMDVLRNETEFAIAKLLSNPKLSEALIRRLKKELL